MMTSKTGRDGSRNLQRKGVRRKPVKNNWRIWALEFFFLAFGLLLIGRLIYIQVLQREKYQKMAKVQYFSEVPLPAQRGLIYDRHQNLLALNEACFSVGLDLRMVKSRSEYAKKLAPILGESAQALLERMRGDRSFVWLRRRLDSELAQKIKAAKLPAIRLEKDARRRYPRQEIAAHVLGYTDIDNRGIAGIELACDSLLRGRNGRKIIQKDAVGNALPEVSIPDILPAQGKSLVLTIDYILQTIATEELRLGIEKFEASGGIAIITNPNTGEILAMVCEPSFNPHAPAAVAVATRRNRAITDLFEPGSTFKLATFSGALQEGRVKPDDVIFCENGSYPVADQVVGDHDKYGNLAVREVLAMSSNIGTVKLAQKLGREKLFQYARDFGFGMSTRMALEGEVSGVLKNPAEWSGYTLAAMAIGYEVSVTAIQMVMAYGAIANGGLLLRPRILAGVIEPTGEMRRFDQVEVVRRVISPAVARTMTQMMEGVVDHGTGENAAIAGVRIAGKTGTAHKPLMAGRGYSHKDFIASFIGFFPANAPRYLMFVMLENPRAAYWGSMVAAPTFQRIAQRILATASLKEQNNVSEKITEMTMDNRTVVVPNITGRPAEASVVILEQLGLKVTREGEGDFVVNQDPAPGAQVAPQTSVTLNLFKMEKSSANGPKRMPNLVGYSVREALQHLALFNVEPAVRGSGRVVRQFPAAGTSISPGMRCEIECQATIPAANATINSSSGLNLP